VDARDKRGHDDLHVVIARSDGDEAIQQVGWQNVIRHLIAAMRRITPSANPPYGL
jgi:hypothetical protein